MERRKLGEYSNNLLWNPHGNAEPSSRDRFKYFSKGITTETNVLVHREINFFSWLNTLAIWCKEPTHQKRPWCWEILKAGAEGDDRGWDCWMASPTRWTWVCARSGSWWWTGKPGVQSMGSQSRMWLSDWTITTKNILSQYSPVCWRLKRHRL